VPSAVYYTWSRVSDTGACSRHDQASNRVPALLSRLQVDFEVSTAWYKQALLAWQKSGGSLSIHCGSPMLLLQACGRAVQLL
jgi:hypothetical protein